MSIDVNYDRTQLRAADVEGGTIESIVVDEYGFLVLVVVPKSRDNARVLISIQRDHEGNGPGAAMPETLELPRGCRIDTDATGAMFVADAPPSSEA